MISFAKYGEDAILEGIIERIEWLQGRRIDPQTYLEIGGYHPTIDSNFAHFYRERGWCGSIYEPNTAFNADFFRDRPDDILHNVAISDVEGEIDFHIFSDGDTSNSINPIFVERKIQAQSTPVTRVEKVRTISLQDAIKAHEESFHALPFVISIDAEGHDLSIMQAFDFSHRPVFFLIESDPFAHFRPSDLLTDLMKRNFYQPIASTILTGIYIDLRHPYAEIITKMGGNE
jgi:FkbM family methyltransferase